MIELVFNTLDGKGHHEETRVWLNGTESLAQLWDLKWLIRLVKYVEPQQAEKDNEKLIVSKIRSQTIAIKRNSKV